MTDARTKAVDAMLELLPHRKVVEAFWDEAYKQGFMYGCTAKEHRWMAARNDLPDTEPATPRHIVNTWDASNGRTVVLMNDRTLWSLVYYTNVDEWERNVDEWEWLQLPSVPQPEEADDD